MQSTQHSDVPMPEHRQVQQSTESKSNAQKQVTTASPTQASNPYFIIQRARINPKSLTHADIMQLQRTIGNRAVGMLLSSIGNTSTVQQATVQRQEIPEEEELLQGKMAETVQRQEIPEKEESLQGKMTSPIQRQEIPEPGEEELSLQGKFENNPEQKTCPSCSTLPIQRETENRTGMPDDLKAGVESLSGMDMSDVRVHYNSDKPVEVGALAYAQGTNIHVAPGQERHLPHEAWHVVQQAQGKVRPTMQLKDVAVNDDVRLESEADVMGEKASQMKHSDQIATSLISLQRRERVTSLFPIGSLSTIQLVLDKALETKLKEDGYHGPENDQYMAFTGRNESGKDVDWKAHIGVSKESRSAVIKVVSPKLKAKGISHKFDVKDTDILPKFVTIYPLADQRKWQKIIGKLEKDLSGIATIIEESTEPVGKMGLIGMRHGQITGLSFDKIQAAGITLTKGQSIQVERGKIDYYTVNEEGKVWEGQRGKLAYVDFMGAFFFITDIGPQAAIIWDGQLRADPRSEWNPFRIALPGGLRTTEDILQEELTRLEDRMKDSEARIDALYATEMDSMMSEDHDLISRRNARKSREYQRLINYSQRTDSVEAMIQKIFVLPKKVARKGQVLNRVQKLKIAIAQQQRRLDVMF